MVTAPAATEAAALARDLPGLDTGLHLVLTDGLPPAAGDSSGALAPDQRFPASPLVQGLRLFWGRGARERLRKEIAAQLDHFLSQQLPLAHLDGHMMLHVHPTVLDVIVDLARDYPIPAVRLPREPLWEVLAFDRAAVIRRGVEGVIFRLLSARARPRLATAGIGHADGIRGLYRTGCMTLPYLRHVIRRLPEGVTEVYTHPTASVPGVTPVHPPHYRGTEELEALCCPDLRAEIERRGIALVGTSALAHR